ncbi:protein of unknown function [Chitinophaga jiangningensis]|uniref:Alpha-L-rhamnosidase six-hairpin glycosidase domain-containing protein n=1 Tax=Chitinophaga jiangningensis TaxID=1419482 RepID=A0A1M6YWW5_9BACT|nr:DUF4450 domain-containing protein [Chitinophaga jiangningensis]SHL22776.1 protein of unknown function [Chitinophaga jiangningensis]
MRRIYKNILIAGCCLLTTTAAAQREMRYQPQQGDFVIHNGSLRFNRALYGGNTGFRVEAGDKPMFAMYLPGMGGNLRFAIKKGKNFKWLSDAADITSRYGHGAMQYDIADPVLERGKITLTVMALYSHEGLIARFTTQQLPAGVTLYCVYGGASGKKFSRDGDIGADSPSLFDLHEANCAGNAYTLTDQQFRLKLANGKTIAGSFPKGATLAVGEAAGLQRADQLPAALTAKDPRAAILIAHMPLTNGVTDISLNTGEQPVSLSGLFEKTKAAARDIADRIKVNTPDSCINNLGSALALAADAVWESPTFLHGAVAWRMRLNAWRGAYIGDALGWHDRAREHFSSYAKSQVTVPPTLGVVADTNLHLARQLEKIGTAMFSDGYICRNPNGDIRAHHYDMNLVFIDQLLRHFNWTGDTAYVREMWPVITRHLAWEKRNFDADGDGLYDAYACIWASDALQYNAGGVTHSSAYNYFSNATAAKLAKLIGEDPSPYAKEAAHILTAMQQQLWMPEKGWFAEYKDKMGKQLLHPSAGLWTIYHALDSKVADRFQAYSCLRYIDEYIPHIPIGKDMYLLSTTNWQPYTWSLNNVALAENLHTALAYWQGGNPEKAYQLWRSVLVESMFMGSSPGNFEQLAKEDAIRGELYRDFADPVAMAARSLVEGLFGIQPDALNGKLLVQPGFPAAWEQASIQTPDITFAYTGKYAERKYVIKPSFSKQLQVSLIIPAPVTTGIKVMVNGKPVAYKPLADAIGTATMQIDLPLAATYEVVVTTPPKHMVRKLELTGRRQMPLVSFDKFEKDGFSWWVPGRHLRPEEATSAMADLGTSYEKVPLDKFFNSKVTDIFQQQYLSPRPAVPTLQLPVQGIGNWCYPLATANIDDSGLRAAAGTGNEVRNTAGVPFQTPGDITEKNIVYTSLWDNYPDSISIPLTGKAKGAWLLMAGSTNAMQSRFTNGFVRVTYTDGSSDTLLLRNPQNWWPIEQDLMNDGKAFTTNAPVPERLYLKQGKFSQGMQQYAAIKGYTTRAVDGGAATVLQMRLQPDKTLATLSVHTQANDVIIGLMSLTLCR